MEREGTFWSKGMSPETSEKKTILDKASGEAQEIIKRREQIAADERARRDAAQGSEKM